MSTDAENLASRSPNPPRLRGRPGSSGRILIVVALAVVLVLAGYGAYAYVQSHPTGGEPTLVIYTYSSLFSGNCGQSTLDALLHQFEQNHSVHVRLVCPSGNLASTLIAQKNAPQADLVIGLDEITAPQADAAGVLTPYTAPGLSYEVPGLADELAPDHAVVPYEYGLLGIDYTPGFRNATHGSVANLSFEAIAANSSWASNLMIEDPTTDITGEEFLLWQIEYYTQVLHQDWKPFWTATDPHLQVATDWSTAYSAFTNSSTASPPQMVSSYTVDVTGVSPGTFYTTVAHHNGTAYAWKTIYGLGIVKGSAHTSVDQEFVDWFLGSGIQSQLPANEYEYPANASTPVVWAYPETVSPSSVAALNTVIDPSMLASYLDQWQTIANQNPSTAGH